jgi:hypothetical protein
VDSAPTLQLILITFGDVVLSPLKYLSVLNVVTVEHTSLLSVLLGRESKEESSASYVKNGNHTRTTFLFENHELNFRQIKEVSTDGSGNVYRTGFYAISYVWVHASKVAQITSSDEYNVPY